MFFPCRPCAGEKENYFFSRKIVAFRFDQRFGELILVSGCAAICPDWNAFLPVIRSWCSSGVFFVMVRYAASSMRRWNYDLLYAIVSYLRCSNPS